LAGFRVDSGQYSSADEVISEAFYWRSRNAIEQDERGESVDGEEFCSLLLNEMDFRIALAEHPLH